MPTQKPSSEYQEYLITQKGALLDVLRTTRYLPGIPLDDIADVLTDVFSLEELYVLQRDIMRFMVLKSQKKGGEDM
jgi:hypothetical protein